MTLTLTLTPTVTLILTLTLTLTTTVTYIQPTRIRRADELLGGALDDGTGTGTLRQLYKQAASVAGRQASDRTSAKPTTHEEINLYI